MQGPSDRTTPALAVRLTGETLAMVRFYSRLPLPSLGAIDDPAAPPAFATACRMLPLAAIVIALPAAAVIAGLGLTALPPFAVAGIAVAVAAATTGALHEDGLADVADGFGGGRTRERKLEIMKDSRLGAYGTIALVLALVIRSSLLAGLLLRSPLAAALGLIAAAVASRVASLAVFALLPTARPDGVAGRVGRPTPGSTATAVVLGLVIVAVGAGLSLGAGPAAAAVAISAAAAFALARLALAQIGGQTGDVIGAAQQLCELGFLIGLSLW
ncbi:MAG: adenosylcobinamide-GDP ribazoletransferase [Ancalomicrobiaceae bacterium]|nr:adenosylcobinamide-GDP ribazoletransferase [Ancalomicrobiaceae bacterium]